MSNARFETKFKWFIFRYIVGGLGGALLFMAIGMGFSHTEVGAILGVPGFFVGWYISWPLILKSVPSWKDLKKKIANEIKRINENEEGMTRKQSLDKLASKSNQRCVVEGFVYSKEFFGTTWRVEITDGDDVISCLFPDRGESKKIEKFKQKIKDGEGSFVKVIGYLRDKDSNGAISCSLGSCGIL